MGARQEPRDIIIIDDDGSSGFQTHHLVQKGDTNDSDDNSSGFNKLTYQQCCWQSANGFNMGQSEYSEKSYNDDCFVLQRDPIESGPSHLSWRLHKRAPKGEKRPVIMRHDLKFSDTSSDCEIIEDLDGKFRQDWERAALKKRFGESYKGGSFRAESEESSSAAGSGARSGFFGKGKGPFQPSDHSSPKKDLYDSGPSCGSFAKDKDSNPVTLLDQQDSNHSIADTRSEESVDSSGEETSATDNGSFSLANHPELLEEGASSADYNNFFVDSNPSERIIQSENVLDRQHDVPVKHRATVEAASEIPTNNLFLVQKGVREPVDQKWLQFQEDLQSQAKEVHYEGKKRRIDNDLKLEMEITQKQRFEKIGCNQVEEGHTHHYNKQSYGHIRSELEGKYGT